MLKVALAPAPVSQHMVDQGLRGFLVAPPDAGQEADAPAGAAQKTRLDEIVGHDQPVALEVGQACARRKGGGPDDCVVAPVVAFLTAPARHAFGKGRAIDAVGELLHPGKDRLGADQLRKALDQTGARIRGQGIGQAQDRAAGHQAVGVENQHGVMGAAPAGHPVGDIADLAVGVHHPAAVIEFQTRRQRAAQRFDRALFLLGQGFVAGVGQDEHRIAVRPAIGPQLFEHRLRIPEHVPGNFVIDRHQQRNLQRPDRRFCDARPLPRQGPQAQGNRADRETDPEEVERDQNDEQTFGKIDPLIREPAVHHHSQGRGCGHGGAEGEHPPQGLATFVLKTRGRDIAIGGTKVLHRHGAGCLGRHHEQVVSHLVHR